MEKNVKIFPLLLILSLVLFLGACSSATSLPATADPTQVAESVNATLAAELPLPTNTPPPTNTPLPTEVPATEIPLPTPTLAPISGDPAVILGEPDGVDTFDSDANWTLFDTQCFKSEIMDGKYFMESKGMAGFVCWEVSWPEIKDFYNEITIDMPLECQPDDRFGLFFRAPDNNRGYLFNLACDGRYSMTMWDGESTTVIVEPTPSEVINVGLGAVNRIGVVAYGGSYLLYANGFFLTEAQDYTFTEAGKLGLFVRASTDQGFVVAYDNLGVWVLEDQYYPPVSSTPPSTSPIPTPDPGAATVTTVTYVNVRSGPGTQYPIYFVAAPGATGQAIGITENGAWFAVILPTTVSGSGIGWVSAAYVIPANTEVLPILVAPTLPPDVDIPPPEASAPTVSNFEPLNVRSGPGTGYPSYGVAPVGSSAPVIGISEDGTWYVVSISTQFAPDGIGWVDKYYVVLSNPSGVQIPVIPNPDQLPPVAPAPPEQDAPTVTSTDAINVRNGPGNQCSSYGVAEIGASAVVTGISVDGKWYQILISTDYAPDGIGWVNANYLITSNTENLPISQSQFCP
jgi:uncharacterized protein YraI